MCFQRYYGRGPGLSGCVLRLGWCPPRFPCSGCIYDLWNRKLTKLKIACGNRNIQSYSDWGRRGFRSSRVDTCIHRHHDVNTLPLSFRWFRLWHCVRRLNDTVMLYRGRALWSSCKGFFAWNQALCSAWAHHVVHMFGCVHPQRRKRNSVQEGMPRWKQFALATWQQPARPWDAWWQWQGVYGGSSNSRGQVFCHIWQRCSGFSMLLPVSSRTCFLEATWPVCCLLAILCFW